MVYHQSFVQTQQQHTMSTEDVQIEPAQKANDPLIGIKSSFNLDAFKRIYSDKDPSESIPYFWQNLDKENFSIWKCDFKYNADYDGKPGFIVANGIGGWFQRLDSMRKHAFGSVCIFKGEEAGKWIVSGVWVLRGQELAFGLCPDWNEDCMVLCCMCTYIF